MISIAILVQCVVLNVSRQLQHAVRACAERFSHISSDQACVSQSCPELAGEAVDYLEDSDDTGLEAPASQLVILAVDETPDAEHLEHLKSALAEVLVWDSFLCIYTNPTLCRLLFFSQALLMPQYSVDCAPVVLIQPLCASSLMAAPYDRGRRCQIGCHGTCLLQCASTTLALLGLQSLEVCL